MSNLYFNKFPKKDFIAFGTLNITSFAPTFPVKTKTVQYNISLTDIFPKIQLLEKVLNDSMTYYPYVWKQSDRPDTLARNYYGDERYFWLVFFSNRAYDLKMDFPMGQDKFTDYLFDKYANDTSLFIEPIADRDQIYAALNGKVHHYETADDNQFVIADAGDPIVSSSSGSVSVSYYEYEERLNEKNRTIKLLSKKHVAQVDYELRKLLSE